MSPHSAKSSVGSHARRNAKTDAGASAHKPWRSANFALDHEHRSPKRERAIEKSLEAIYMGPDGRLPDLRHLTRRRRRMWVPVGTGLAVLSVCAAVFVWTGSVRGISWLGGAPKAQALSLSIAAPGTVTLGREEVITITWGNHADAKLAHADVRVAWPSEFTPTAFDPAPADGVVRQWLLGPVSAGATGTLRVTGVFTGALGGQGTIQAMASSRVSRESSSLDSVAMQAVTYGDSVIEGAIEGPENAVAGDTIRLTYRFRNRGSYLLRGLWLRFTPPSGFIPSGFATSTVMSGEPILLSLPELPVGASSSRDWYGMVLPSVVGSAVFQMEVGQRLADGTYVAFQRNQKNMSVLAGDVALPLVVNGSSADQIIRPGDPVHLTIGYENMSPEEMRGASFRLGFESIVNGRSATGVTVLDWHALKDGAGGTTSTRSRMQSILYDATTQRGLDPLLPQSRREWDVTIPTLSVASGTSQAAVRITWEAKIPSIAGARVDRVMKAHPILLRYGSEAALLRDVRYATEEGAPVGSGPLPPVVGQTTTYRVFWRLTKSLHVLERLMVKATLPAHTALGSFTSAQAGSIDFDATTRTLTWRLNKMPETVSVLEAAFDVHVTPSSADVGRFAPVLGETRFEAADTVVGETIAHTASAVTTDLVEDEMARGKGVVRKE